MMPSQEPSYGPTAALKCIECKVGPFIPKKISDFYSFCYNHMHHIESLRVELV